MANYPLLLFLWAFLSVPVPPDRAVKKLVLILFLCLIPFANSAAAESLHSP
jgi:hypothetical protein